MVEFVQIPLPDFNFSDIVKEKAIETCTQELDLNAVEQFFSMEQLDYSKEKKLQLTEYIDELNSNEDRIIYISVILNHLSNLIEKIKNQPMKPDFNYTLSAINKARYFYYGRAKNIGYNFDRNAFSDSQSSAINKKIDDIIHALDKLQAGQEILYNQYEEVKGQIKGDFESLKTDRPLGKKRFFKMVLGTIGSYTGNKIADEIFAQIKPYIMELLRQEAPHLLDRVMKLLS